MDEKPHFCRIDRSSLVRLERVSHEPDWENINEGRFAGGWASRMKSFIAITEQMVKWT